MMISARLELQRLLRFGLVGATTTAISFATYLAALSTLEARYEVAYSQALSYAVGMLWSFLWNRRWAFESTGDSAGEALRFILSQVSLLVLSSLTVLALSESAGLGPIWGWVVGVAGITVLNYVILRTWVFTPAEA